MVYTSSALEQGWGRNRFFAMTPNGPQEISLRIETEEGLKTHVHRNEYYHFNHQDLLPLLPLGADTMLWDGTHIIKYAEDDILYNKGVKTVEFFYLTKEAQPVTFNPPANPHDVSDKPLIEQYQR
jgi:hypothetical protein